MPKTVLVTGVGGFVAMQLTLQLLNSGYSVRGTLRDHSKQNSIRDALLAAGATVDKLSFVELNLLEDFGWREAAEGCDVIQHIASPFPMAQPRNREALVPEAVGGTLRVLNAAKAAGVKRMIITSSIAAMMYRAGRPKDVFHFSESDWTDPQWLGAHPYSISKARAELAAWKWAGENNYRDRLVVINPGVVLGPLITNSGNTSSEIVRLMLEGGMPRTLPIANPIVDVRDVAALHVAAMTAENVVGRRLLATSDTISFAEMVEILRDQFPALSEKLPKGELAPFMTLILKYLLPQVRIIRSEVGIRSCADAKYVTELTGIKFRPAKEALLATAASLLR